MYWRSQKVSYLAGSVAARAEVKWPRTNNPPPRLATSRPKKMPLKPQRRNEKCVLSIQKLLLVKENENRRQRNEAFSTSHPLTAYAIELSTIQHCATLLRSCAYLFPHS